MSTNFYNVIVQTSSHPLLGSLFMCCLKKRTKNTRPYFLDAPRTIRINQSPDFYIIDRQPCFCVFLDFWFSDFRYGFQLRITYIKFIRQFQQIKIAVMFIHMKVGKNEVEECFRIAFSPFGVLQENTTRVLLPESEFANSGYLKQHQCCHRSR